MILFLIFYLTSNGLILIQSICLMEKWTLYPYHLLEDYQIEGKYLNRRYQFLIKNNLTLVYSGVLYIFICYKKRKGPPHLH